MQIYDEVRLLLAMVARARSDLTIQGVTEKERRTAVEFLAHLVSEEDVDRWQKMTVKN